MQLTTLDRTPAEADTVRILNQLSVNQWPQELLCLKPESWDQGDQTMREKLIYQHLHAITHHIELRACFLENKRGTLTPEEFNHWYETQIIQSHYLSV